MAKPLTLSQTEVTFNLWHVPYFVVPGAESRRNAGSWWIDVSGCMFHHTASDISDEASRTLLVRGHSTLAGPLANFGVTDTGTIDIIAIGPANHAGGGDPVVLDQVMRESYGDYPSKSTKTHGEPGATSGNPRFYGWEVYYGWGNDLYINDIQYRATILSMAAIIYALDKYDGPSTKWTAKSMIGHKEWQKYKPDPSGVDMKDARSDLQWCLDNGPDAAFGWYISGERVAQQEKDWLSMATEKEVRDIIREEIRAALTEWKAFRTHDTYDAVTGERLENVEPRLGTLEYAIWCAVRDSRQGKDLALTFASEGAPLEKAVKANPKGE